MEALEWLRELGVLGLFGLYLFWQIKFVQPRREHDQQEALERVTEHCKEMLAAQGEVFRSVGQGIAARQRKTSENLGRLIERMSAFHDDLKRHQIEEETTLKAHSDHLRGIREGIKDLTKK